MSLTPGQRLGPYEIVAPVGAGGMGEVYRARDTRLERSVAVKVLPRELSENAQLKARFQREAKTISQISHPHICTLFDVGNESGIDFIVMELLEGETLADRMTKGPLPLAEALRVGVQIAEALDRAHRQQVVHRDLKPGNVILTRSGAKLVDFGLAKPVGGGHSSPDEPTAQKPLTEEGVIVGTFQYMAPEQLEGTEADARTDIFALGTVLYEMVTGRRAFQGKTRMSLIAAIMGATPEPISTVQPVTPPALEHVVSRCLEKDPERRWQSAHDVAEELKWIAEAGSQAGAAVPRARRHSLRWAAPVAMLLAGALLGAFAYSRLSGREAPEPRPLRYVIEHGDFSASRPSLSPDGRNVAYVRDGRLVVRNLARLEVRAIPGTEGGFVPTWSPDGNWIAFWTSQAMWKVRLDGSGLTQLCQTVIGSNSGGAVWTGDGRILFTTGSAGLYEVSDRGGDPRVVVEVGEGEVDFHDLAALPDGRGVVFVVHHGELFDQIDAWDGSSRRTVYRHEGVNVGNLAYTGSGHLIFSRYAQGMGLWAVPLPAGRLVTEGEPFPIAPGANHPTVSGSTLVYTPAGPQGIASEIVEVSRDGSVIRTIGPPRAGLGPDLALSPDGTRIAATVVGTRGSDIWLFEAGGDEPSRLTFHDRALVAGPAWSPDGDLVFTVHDEISQYRIESISPGAASRTLGFGAGPVSFSGGRMVYVRHSKGFNFDLWMSDSDDPDQGREIIGGDGWDLAPAISPDGAYIAYQNSGATFIRTFPGLGGPWQVKEGCSVPRWSRSGDRVFCLSGDEMIEVPVLTGEAGARIGTPKTLFSFAQAPGVPLLSTGPRFEIGPGGDTFLLVRPLERPPGIVVVHDWLAAIE
jgi:eukaryotic-like serine/threonine-protein kinase